MVPLVNRGPSPRVRGSLANEAQGQHDPGSIPARAGEPSVLGQYEVGLLVHPRACGGASGVDVLRTICLGPSPRVRGSLVEQEGIGAALGSIPARAGEPD